MKDVFTFTSRPLCPREIIRHPFEWAGLTTDPVWTFWRRKKNSFLLSGFEPWIVQPAADSLNRWRYPTDDTQYHQKVPGIRRHNLQLFAGLIYRICYVKEISAHLTSFVALGMRSEGDAPKNEEPTAGFSFMTMLQHTGRLG
jgi:hypothetical protein